MKGSQKQIEWAESIINNALKSWDDLSAEVNPAAKERFEQMKNSFMSAMSSDDASVVIANRMSYPEDAKHLKSNLAFFVKAKLV